MKTVLLGLVVVGALIGGYFLFNASGDGGEVEGTSTASKQISKVELATADGKNGNKCYVAVDGTVYEIRGFAAWVNGIHTTSEGKASCGRDLSNVIDESPHGKAKLALLTKVGSLE